MEDAFRFFFDGDRRFNSVVATSMRVVWGTGNGLSAKTVGTDRIWCRPTAAMFGDGPDAGGDGISFH